jgi:hypothetical protein
MSNEDLIRRVADELEIRNAIAKLALLTDHHDDMDAYAEIFAEDVRWEVKLNMKPSTPSIVHGREAMRAASAQRRKEGAGPSSHRYHVVPMIAVTLNGDTAEAESVMTFYVNADSKPEVVSMGFYHDKFIRTPQGWKIKERLVLQA